MANQAPGRPWFRLASLRSVAAPPPAPAPSQDTRPSLLQPANRINLSQPPAERRSVPSSPAHSSSPSLPNSLLHNGSASSSVSSSSPIQKASPPHSSASSPTKGGTSTPKNQVVQAKPTTPPPSASLTQKATTPQSASSTTSKKQVVQTVMQSPEARTTTPPPSPLTLPPAQLKANPEFNPIIPEEPESKNVIHQKRIESPNKRGNYKSGENLNRNHRKSDELPMKVITIAGENRGAYMELIQSPKKNETGDKSNYLYRNGVSKIKSENEESGSSSSGDDGKVKKKENRNNRRAKNSNQMSAFMNSNVQCVNNSMLYNASCSHHNPGLRLSLTRKPFERGGFHYNEIVNGRND